MRPSRHLSRNSSYSYTDERSIPRMVSEDRNPPVRRHPLQGVRDFSETFVCENPAEGALRRRPPSPSGSSAPRNANGSSASPPRSSPATSRPTSPSPAPTAGGSHER